MLLIGEQELMPERRRVGREHQRGRTKASDGGVWLDRRYRRGAGVGLSGFTDSIVAQITLGAGGLWHSRRYGNTLR
jgi:hypothetical protein